MGELIGGVTAFMVAVVLSIKWLISTHTEKRVKETTGEIDVKRLEARVASLEADLKSMAENNLLLSQSFHSEINKILHKLSGDYNG